MDTDPRPAGWKLRITPKGFQYEFVSVIVAIADREGARAALRKVEPTRCNGELEPVRSETLTKLRMRRGDVKWI